MAAEPPTVAGLRGAGIINSQEIVSAIDIFLRDPSTGLYRFASGHSLDVRALVNTAPALAMMERSGSNEIAFRAALARAVMAARPASP